MDEPESERPSAPQEHVDRRQDEIMTENSTDGRPPSRQTRQREWWVGAAIGVLVLLTVASIMSARGFSSGAIAATLGIGVIMMGAAWPVWSAGIMRGREEREARDRAEREIRVGRMR